MSAADARLKSFIDNYRTATSGAAKKNGGTPEGARRGIQNMLNVAKRKTEDNLVTMINQGKHYVFTATVDITPEMAKELLERNPDNRPVRFKGVSRSVEAYAQAMFRDEWLLNGEPVIVSKDGFLNDGQHRLHAVIQSGKTVTMQITFGVDRDSRHTVDQGSARTPGNILAMFGEKSSNHLAHALQFVWAYDDANRVFGYRPSPEQMLDTLDGNPGLREAVNSVKPLCREFRTSVGYMAGAYYVCARAYPETADEFIDGTCTGLNISDGNSPIFRLRKRFQDHVAKRDILPAIEQAALFIKAFNAFRRRRSTQTLRWRRNGAAAEEFPVVGQ